MSDTIARIIDMGTGEVIKDINEGDKVKVTRKESIQHMNQAMKLNDKEGFAKLYCSILEGLINENLTSAEFNIVLTCLKNLNYGSGAVAFANNGNFLSLQDIIDNTKLSKSSAIRGINRLVDLHILHKGKTGKEFQLFVNPFIFMKGAEINRTLYDMFKKSKWNKGETKRGKR